MLFARPSGLTGKQSGKCSARKWRKYNSQVKDDNSLCHTVLLCSQGDITLKLFPEECPRTVENFTTHANNGYYDNVIFHRVIKGFMLQTGDPLGE